MFEKQSVTVHAARAILSSKYPESDLVSPVPIELGFHLDVAKSILLMCSIIYERDPEFIQAAFNYPEQAHLNLLRSEESMLKKGEEWGCHFVSIADFQTAQGPFAGAFYDLDSRPNPFMVLVFKGTSPEAIREWIIDVTFNLEACGDCLGTGFAHQGFYSTLFLSPDASTQPSPHLRIIDTIRLISKSGYERTGSCMNLFIGGHSLGAGIASLFYARLLESPQDLGPHTILRDAYCFGTPRACSASLASRFEHNLSKPANWHRTFWRIANRSFASHIGDIVTRVPPGLGDRRKSRSVLREPNLLSYTAIGIPIDLLPNGRTPYYKFVSSPCGYQLKAIKSPQAEVQMTGKRMRRGPISWFDAILRIATPIFHDHLPGSYMNSLNRISAQISAEKA